MESYGYALTDAIAAVKAEPSYLKGYYRRAAAHMSLGKFKQALGDFEYVAKRRPQDKDAELKYKECQKIINKQKFERAIATETPAGQTLATMYRELDNICEYCLSLPTMIKTHIWLLRSIFWCRPTLITNLN